MVSALRKDAQAWHHVTRVLRFDPEWIVHFRLGLHVDRSGRRWLAYPYQRGGTFTYANLRSIDGPKKFRRMPSGQPTHLYNVDALEERGTAILVEGERDVLAAYTIGLSNEVGGDSGAAIVGLPGASQVAIAAEALRGQQLVYLFTDADPAGDEAAQAIAAALKGMKCLRPRLTRYKDCGDALSEDEP